MNVNEFNKELQSQRDQSAELSTKLGGVLNAHNVTKLSSELKLIDTKISKLLTNIDKGLSQKNLPEQSKRAFSRIKVQLEGERAFFQSKTVMISAYQKLYSKAAPETQKLLNRAVDGMAKGVNSKSFRADLEKLIDLLEPSKLQGFSENEALVVEDLQSKLKQLHFENSLETVTAKAAPILNQPDQGMAARTAFKIGHFPAVENVIEMQRLQKTGQVKSAEAVGAAADQTALESVQKAVPFLFDDFEKTQVSTVEKGTPPVTYLELANPTLGKHEIKLEDWQKADKIKLQLSNSQLSNYEKMASGAADGFEFKARYMEGDNRVPNDKFFAMRESQDNMVESGDKLSYAEKLAINVYTGPAFTNTNSVLRGGIQGKSGAEIKEAMVHGMVFAQTFPKLPDYNDISQRRWRGETAGQMRRDQLMAMIDKGQHVIDNYSFTSVSYAETEETLRSPPEGPGGPTTTFFPDDSPWGTVFTEPMGGKLITPWSQYQAGEREVVFPPGRFYFEGYFKAGDLTIFKARPVK
jgi:hypothetical protein